MNPVTAAADHLRTTYGAVFVAVYGSFASGTPDEASDIDVVAFAPVTVPVHDTVVIAGRDLDAWIYPLGHRTDDPGFVRLWPLTPVFDPEGRFDALVAAVEETRRKAHEPLDAPARAELTAWVAKMLVRARTGTPEGNHRYHWLLSEAPELWCRFTDRPWEGPKKTMAVLRRDDPGRYQALATLLSSAPDPQALARWFDV